MPYENIKALCSPFGNSVLFSNSVSMNFTGLQMLSLLISLSDFAY